MGSRCGRPAPTGGVPVRGTVGSAVRPSVGRVEHQPLPHSDGPGARIDPRRRQARWAAEAEAEAAEAVTAVSWRWSGALLLPALALVVAHNVVDMVRAIRWGG